MDSGVTPEIVAITQVQVPLYYELFGFPNILKARLCMLCVDNMILKETQAGCTE